MRPSRLARLVVLSAFLCLSWVAHAAPFVPSDDNEIVERLPLSATDPSVRRVDSLRKQIDAQPGNTGLRIELARRYFDLAGAQGDPRYVGYAQAALRPLAGVAESNPNYWLVLGMLQQYSHDFAGALTSLNRANQIDPQLAEPMAWRAAIYMVQARYPEALAECEKLPAYVHPLFATGCSAYVRATTGALAASFETLRNAVDTAKGAPPELVLWELNRLADMALRLQQPDLAGNLFQRALKIGVTDQYLLGDYADFLLLRGRPQEVIQLLADWERSDILLLRLALAGKAAGHAKAADWASQLADRFAAAAQRGDRLHEQEAARFELDVLGRADAALAYAERNYGTQKEPRDAEILMRSALAAGKPSAARPALDWLRQSRYEDPSLTALAAKLQTR